MNQKHMYYEEHVCVLTSIFGFNNILLVVAYTENVSIFCHLYKNFTFAKNSAKFVCTVFRIYIFIWPISSYNNIMVFVNNFNTEEKESGKCYVLLSYIKYFRAKHILYWSSERNKDKKKKWENISCWTMKFNWKYFI